MEDMAGRECYHCKQWVEHGEAHDCWTTTEAALTQDLSEDLQDAWERLRETAVSFGEQRIYASHKSIMFSRKSCYFFVRPNRNFLEVCVFLGRALKAPQVRRIDRASKSKVVHFIQIRHRDEVEAPITDWLREAYELSGVLAAKVATKRAKSKSAPKPRKKAVIETYRSTDPVFCLDRFSGVGSNASKGGAQPRNHIDSRNDGLDHGFRWTGRKDANSRGVRRHRDRHCRRRHPASPHD